MERKINNKTVSVTAIFLFAIIGYLLLAGGCLTGPGQKGGDAVPTFPAFLPDILDKAIINSPPGKDGPAPFIFTFDTVNATGFREVMDSEPGAPTLVLEANKSATLPIIVASETDAVLSINVLRTDGLTDGFQVVYSPVSFTLERHDEAKIEMTVISSKNLSGSTEAVVVWLEGAGWEIGRCFYLEHD